MGGKHLKLKKGADMVVISVSLSDQRAIQNVIVARVVEWELDSVLRIQVKQFLDGVVDSQPGECNLWRLEHRRIRIGRPD
jgi:hypothetical protein